MLLMVFLSLLKSGATNFTVVSKKNYRIYTVIVSIVAAIQKI
jgi:hypothetical protein